MKAPNTRATNLTSNTMAFVCELLIDGVSHGPVSAVFGETHTPATTLGGDGGNTPNLMIACIRQSSDSASAGTPAGAGAGTSAGAVYQFAVGEDGGAVFVDDARTRTISWVDSAANAAPPPLVQKRGAGSGAGAGAGSLKRAFALAFRRVYSESERSVRSRYDRFVAVVRELERTRKLRRFVASLSELVPNFAMPPPLGGLAPLPEDARAGVWSRTPPPADVIDDDEASAKKKKKEEKEKTTKAEDGAAETHGGKAKKKEDAEQVSLS